MNLQTRRTEIFKSKNNGVKIRYATELSINIAQFYANKIKIMIHLERVKPDIFVTFSLTAKLLSLPFKNIPLDRHF